LIKSEKWHISQNWQYLKAIIRFSPFNDLFKHLNFTVISRGRGYDEVTISYYVKITGFDLTLSAQQIQ
jgi:hypothetical protein